MDKSPAHPVIPRPPTTSSPLVVAGVTNRQAQALTFVAHGFTSRETAAALDLSPRTIEDYVATGKRAVGAGSRAEIVQWAISRGLFPSRPGLLEAELQQQLEVPTVVIQPR